MQARRAAQELADLTGLPVGCSREVLDALRDLPFGSPERFAVFARVFQPGSAHGPADSEDEQAGCR